MNVQKIIEIINKTYDARTRNMQLDADTGLVLGNLENNVSNVVVSLECSISTILYAIDLGANFIICHHNPFFSTVKSYNTADYAVKVLQLALQNEISIYCAHTEVDQAPIPFDISSRLAKTLSFKPIRKISSACNFGVLCEVDFLSSENLIKEIRENKNIMMLSFNAKIDQKIDRVAIISGSGSKYWREVQAENCDVLITGDVDYHTALDARNNNFLIIDIGHQAEEIYTELLLECLSPHDIGVFKYVESNFVLNR